jgi:hypothetical protein
MWIRDKTLQARGLLVTCPLLRRPLLRLQEENGWRPFLRTFQVVVVLRFLPKWNPGPTRIRPRRVHLPVGALRGANHYP